MEIEVLGFGIAKDIFEGPKAKVQLAGAATVAALKDALEQQYPRLKELQSYMIAVNDEYTAGDKLIDAADEVAIIPPVSGG